MTYEKKKQFLVKLTYFAVVVAIIYLVYKYLIVWTLPFIIGFIIAFCLKPITTFLTRITKMKAKGIAYAVLAIFYALIGVLIWLLSIVLIKSVYQFVTDIPSMYNDTISPALLSINTWISDTLSHLSPDAASAASSILSGVVSEFATFIKGLSGDIISSLTVQIAAFPVALITIIFTILCSVFISADYSSVVNFILRQFSEPTQRAILDTKNFLTGNFFKVIRAYFIIMLITFAELSIGFLILGIDKAVVIAAIIAVLDILPAIGTGGIVIPWAVFSFVTGNPFLGVGLLIIYIIVLIVRNIVEPKIVGQQIGLHPLVTITAMYAGLKMFGFIGFIGAPITILILKYLNDNGKIHLFK